MLISDYNIIAILFFPPIFPLTEPLTKIKATLNVVVKPCKPKVCQHTISVAYQDIYDLILLFAKAWCWDSVFNQLCGWNKME